MASYKLMILWEARKWQSVFSNFLEASKDEIHHWSTNFIPYLRLYKVRDHYKMATLRSKIPSPETKDKLASTWIEIKLATCETIENWHIEIIDSALKKVYKLLGLPNFMGKIGTRMFFFFKFCLLISVLWEEFPYQNMTRNHYFTKCQVLVFTEFGINVFPL